VNGHKLALHMADTSDRRNNADLSIVFPSRDAARAAQTPIATAVPLPKGSKAVRFHANGVTLWTDLLSISFRVGNFCMSGAD
jgi:2-C-methyl-D-erythritol 4-phosphate cytidylyltransferase